MMTRPLASGCAGRTDRGAAGWFNWLDDEWVAYATWMRKETGYTRQIGIVNTRTLQGQRLTGGPYVHTLCDYKDGCFLISETPTTPTGGNHAEYTSRLYVIEPLRVRM
jgi:hypothetical protein